MLTPKPPPPAIARKDGEDASGCRLIRKDAQWIYDTLARAFVAETGKEWQSYSRIKLRGITPEVEGEKLEIAKHMLEIDCIEFEVE